MAGTGRRGRPPAGATPRDRMFRMRATEGFLATLDRHRGAWSRSEFVREAVRYAITHGFRGPGGGS